MSPFFRLAEIVPCSMWCLEVCSNAQIAGFFEALHWLDGGGQHVTRPQHQ